MPLCPNQHESHTLDFCEVCGAEIPAAVGGDSVAPAPAGGAGEICPACHAEHDAAVGIFCEVCGYNFKTGTRPVPAPATPPTATKPAAVVLDDNLLEFVITVATTPHNGMPDAKLPPTLAPWILPLDRETLLIGRRSIRRNISPEITLDHDDGVSHRHAQLIRTADGAFSLSDLGSSNGTTLNGAEILPGVAVTLKEGDIIALGRWTYLTLRRKIPGVKPTLSSSEDSPHAP